MSESAPRTKADTLFGKIALEEGLVTPAQLRECLELQAFMEPPIPPLGVLMMRLGYIDQPKLDRIIEVQRERLRSWQNSVRAKREDNLFGKVVLRMGLATETQVQVCLEAQDALPPDRFRRLGDILVDQGVLTLDNVRQVLDFQAGLVLYCPGCDREYNMVLFNAGAKIGCYQCGARIRVPQGRTVDEVAALARTGAGPAAGEGTGGLPPSGALPDGNAQDGA